MLKFLSNCCSGNKDRVQDDLINDMYNSEEKQTNSQLIVSPKKGKESNISIDSNLHPLQILGFMSSAVEDVTKEAKLVVMQLTRERLREKFTNWVKENHPDKLECTNKETNTKNFQIYQKAYKDTLKALHRRDLWIKNKAQKSK